MDFPDCLLLLLSISVSYFLVFLLYFLVVDSTSFRAHVKIAPRIVSYRIECTVWFATWRSG